VTQRLLDAGAYSAPSSPIVRVSQLDTVFVNVNVPDDSLAYMRSGMPVSFTTGSIPGRTFHGVVREVNATPTTGTLSYRAQLMQPNPDGVLRGGMLVALTVQKELHKDAIVVPRTAVAETEQGSFVFTVKDGKAVQVPVRLGLQTDTLAEVQSPDVKAGTDVIATRPDSLQNGSLVMVGGPGGGPAGAGGRAQ
jgi:membrane fusion protein (multidrug efflux system)